MGTKLIATNTDGDKPIRLYRSESGAYSIEVGGSIAEFGLDFRQGFTSFGIQVMWACMRSGKINSKGD